MVASTWTSGVAEAAYRAITAQAPSMREDENTWHAYFCRGVLIANYSVLCLVLQSLPWIGRPLAFAVMSIVDAYFCFEQVWIVRGWSLEKRLRFCESHWSYLFGFGVPSTAVSFFHPSGMLNLMLFMLVFPFCTLIAYLAEPLPHSTSIGAQTSMLPTTPTTGSRELSILLPARIPFFWPTVHIRRWLYRFVAPAPKKAFIPAPASKPRTSLDTASPARRSAATFVDGAWTSASPTTWQASSVSIPMADTIGSRRSHVYK